MRIDITTRSEYHDNHATSLFWIVASVYDLQRTLNGLMRHLPPSRFQIVVGTHDPFQKYPQHHERMLECLHGVRGVASASVQGIQLQSSNKEIERRMMTQYEHGAERMEQLRTYQRRGDRQVALGKHLEAAMIYKDGLFDPWCFLCDFPSNEAEFSSWQIQIFVLRTASAFCSIKVGHIAEALSEIRSLRRKSCAPDPEKARALYVRGLILLAEGLYTDASIVFHKALTLHPGYEAVVLELDRMKAKCQAPHGSDDAS